MEQRVLRKARVRRVIVPAVLVAAVVAALLAFPFPNSTDQGVSTRPRVVPAGEARTPGPPCTTKRFILARKDVLPATARCRSSATGDFDGDGSKDRVFSYGLMGRRLKSNPDWYDTTWYLRVVFSDGRTITVTAPTEMKFGMGLFPRLAGTADADGDGKSEIFFAHEVGNGATLSIYALDGRSLRQVYEPPRPFAFSVAGSINFRSGMSCEGTSEDPRLVVRTAEVTEGGGFHVTTTGYRWTAQSTVTQASFDEADVGSDDPALKEVQRLSCRGLQWRA
jgi:hypothetical protein